MRFLIALLLALACSGSIRAAATAEKQLKTFIEVARAAAAKLPPPPAIPSETDVRTRSPQPNIATLLDYLEKQPAPIAPESAQSIVAQVSAILASFPKVKKAGDALIATLTADRNDRLSRYRAEVDALLAKSAQACLAATKPADLDEPLKALAPYQRPNDDQARRSMIDYGAQQRASQMFRFVTRWQDYLGASQSGDAARVKQALYELRDLIDPTLIPRSKLFELPPKADATPTTNAPANSVASAQETLSLVLGRLEKVANLDELEPVAKDLGTVMRNRDDHRLQEIWLVVTSLLGDRKALASGQVNPGLFFKNGRLVSPAANPYCSETMASALRRLSVELQRETLRSVFKDSGIPLAADESVDAYILRVAQASAAAENWEYTLRTLEFYRALFSGTAAPAWIEREMQSCTTYVTARRLDEAKQIPQSILAYQDALRATGRLTPVALISARLADFKARQPEAFDIAARLPRVIFMPTSPYMQDRFNRQQPEAPNTYLIPRAERPFTP
ncbi:MAG: hypothetical protein WC661_09405 [Opitutaceae bacterium]|jgi:hypothetical protein